MDVIQENEKNGVKLSIYVDETPSNPRDNDNMWTIVCWHRRYTLGDPNEYDTPAPWFFSELTEAEKRTAYKILHGVKRVPAKVDHEDTLGCNDGLRAMEKVLKKKALLLPLYLFDHSGLSLSLNAERFRAFDSAQWDWGQLGFMYIPFHRIKHEYGVTRITDKVFQKAIDLATAELEEYENYVEGRVYGYVIEKDDEETDSCWGFYGDDFKKNGMADCLGDHADLL